MRSHVPSLAACRRLKSAGFSQKTEFRWIEGELTYIMNSDDSIAAPIHTEILKELPATKLDHKTGFTYYLTTMRATERGQWLVGYFHPFQPPELASWLLCVKNDSLLEATAELWLDLHEGN